MKIILRSLAFTVLWTIAAAPAQQPDFFPVMPWNNVPHDFAVLKKIRECGFTVAGFVEPKTLKLCRKAGLKAIVSDPRTSGYDWMNMDLQTMHRNVTSLVREVGKDSAVIGYYLQDEPGANSFPGLAMAVSVLRQQAPDKLAYINLFPNYADSDQLHTATYPEYLQKFCDVCHPGILSYDHYALYEDGSMGPLYWKNLEQMRAASLRNGVPFWNVVLSVGHLIYRVPTETDLRFEVYSSLAYGARGIAYYEYLSSPTGNYRNGAIDQFGHRTPTWYSLRNINLQIAALAPTLLQLTSDDVYHFNHLPDGCHGPTDKDLISGFDGGDFMVGDFTDRHSIRYTLIVNKSLSRSARCNPRFRTPPKSVRLVSPYSGQLTDFEGENCWLAPGQGALLKLQ
ncbi:MAG: hypothetical protein ACREE6_13435 [Limisphaerales bacterium]